MRLPEFVTCKLSPTGLKEPRWKRLLRRIACAIEGHPTASWDDLGSDILTCDWCGASWKESPVSSSK